MRPYKCATCGSTDLSLKLKWNNYCRPCYAKYARERRKLYPHKHKVRGLKRILRSHNLTGFRYVQTWYEQGGRCSSCHRSVKLVVDHDHRCCPGRTSCGRCFRGLICTNCNISVGHMQDDWRRARMVMEYLRASEERKYAV